MSYKISYDYSEMIQEFKEDLEDGILKKDDIIQVLRGNKIYDLYSPVIDWYYSDKKVNEDLKIDITDTEQDILFKQEYKKQYLKDKPNLNQTTVAAILIEMEDMNKII
jgi:hypothetical protein